MHESDIDIVALGESLLGRANSDEEVEIVLSIGTETEIRAYNGEVESLTQASSSGIGIRVIAHGKVGFAHTSSLEASEVELTLKSARENARYTSFDEYVGLALPDDVLQPEIDLFDPSILLTPTEVKVQKALDLEASIRRGDSRISEVPFATYGDTYGEMAILSTAGVRSYAKESYAFAMAQAVARDEGDTQTGYGYSVGRSFDLVDIAEAAADAVSRSTRLLGAKKPKSAKVRVVFEPRVTSNLLSIIGGSLSAESVQKGRSMFTGRKGEVIASSLVTIADDPTDRDFQTASPFDGEGLASRRTPLIAEGVLKEYLYDAYTARKDGRASGANAVRGGYSGTPTPGPRALSLEATSTAPEEIYALIGNGILVQTISGIHSGVNPISGDFSVGAEGVVIRDGKLAEGFREATISSTLQRILHGVVSIGNDQTFFPGIAAGTTMAIDEMSLSGS